MLGYSIFNANGILAPYTEDQSTKLLKQDLGIALQQKRDESMTKAIKEPQQWIDDYNGEIDKAVAEAGKAMHSYQTSLLNAGVPTNQARERAVAHANEIYLSQKYIVDLQNPAYGTAVGSLHVDRQDMNGRAKLYGSAVGESEKDIYRRVKARKDAKKSAKKTA